MMTAWKTKFTSEEIEAWKNSVDDEDLKARIDEILKCLGLCVTNKILVSIERVAPQSPEFTIPNPNYSSKALGEAVAAALEHEDKLGATKGRSI